MRLGLGMGLGLEHGGFGGLELLELLGGLEILEVWVEVWRF
jgi:hypothetical protein